MLTPTIKVWKTAYLSTNLTVCPRARGVRLLGQGVRFFGFFHLVCRGYVYVGRVRTFFPKILQGVRFLVDGYVYQVPIVGGFMIINNQKWS